MHVLHVSTQRPYAIAVTVISFVCCILAGFIQNAVICLAAGVVLVMGFLCLVRWMNAKQDKKLVQLNN